MAAGNSNKKPGACLRLHDPQEPGRRIPRCGHPPCSPSTTPPPPPPPPPPPCLQRNLVLHRITPRQAAGLVLLGQKKALAMAVKNTTWPPRVTPRLGGVVS